MIDVKNLYMLPAEQLYFLRDKSEALKSDLTNTCALLDLGTLSDFSHASETTLIGYLEAVAEIVERAKQVADELHEKLYML